MKFLYLFDNSLFLFLLASRESAFISGITSAGVTYAVTEACAEGKSVHCRCDNSFRGRTEEGWRWGGCNRPISYGIWFATLFIDQYEKFIRKKRNPRKEMNLHNNIAGREVYSDQIFFRNCYQYLQANTYSNLTVETLEKCFQI